MFRLTDTESPLLDVGKGCPIFRGNMNVVSILEILIEGIGRGREPTLCTHGQILVCATGKGKKVRGVYWAPCSRIASRQPQLEASCRCSWFVFCYGFLCMFKLKPPAQVVHPLLTILVALIIERVVPPLREVIIIGIPQVSATVALHNFSNSYNVFISLMLHCIY